MASEVDICNQALSWLGANQIVSLDDGTTESILCKANYAALRDDVLEKLPWTFAVNRLQLALQVEAPLFGYTNKFLIPSTVIRVLNAYNNSFFKNEATIFEWRKEGQFIVADNDVVYVRVIEQVIDPSAFTPAFRQTLAARIASELAMPLVQSEKLMVTMENKYMSRLQDAATQDGMVGKSDRFDATRLINARIGVNLGNSGEFQT